MLTWLSGLPAVTLITAAVLIVVAESGLVGGILIPVGAVLTLLGAHLAENMFALVLTVLLIALASISGVCLGYHRCAGTQIARHSRPTGHLHRLIVRRARLAAGRAERLVHRYPVIAAAIGQCFVGTRTMVPRIAGSAGVPLRQLLRGARSRPP